MQPKSLLSFETIRSRVTLAIAVMLILAGAASAQTASPQTVSPQTVSPRPCDLFAPTTPCVAAFSTTRALYSAYTGPLYQVTRQSDKTQTDIGLLSDGYANAAPQDDFCANTSCIISKIYDQSPNHSDLTPAPPNPTAREHERAVNYDLPAVANALPITIAGHKVYGIDIEAGMGYRNNTAKGTAVNGQPEGVYMVTSSLHVNDKCCFDFGNAETNNLDNGVAHMDAINIMCNGSPCSNDASLDQEDGLYGHLKVPAGIPFVTVMGACDGQHKFAIYQGNAQSGPLTTTKVVDLRDIYQPMHQEGAIILGIGGDNSDAATGYFFEGVMTKGMPKAKAMQAIQNNIIEAHYAGDLKP